MASADQNKPEDGPPPTAAAAVVVGAGAGAGATGGPAQTVEDRAAPAAGAGNNLENFKVAVRLRPFTERERQRQSKRIVDIGQNTVALYNPRAAHEESSTKKFTFDYSYWSHDGFRRNADGVNVPDPAQPHGPKYVGQERVFADLGRFLLENALQGYNSALLAYGQTGSGKSYTVSGYGQNEGILPRFARELFAELERRLSACEQEGGEGGGGGGQNSREEADRAAAEHESKTSPQAPQTQTQMPPPAQQPKEAAPKAGAKRRNRFEVFFSMIEIYNEVVRDLLAKQTGAQAQAGAAQGAPQAPGTASGAGGQQQLQSQPVHRRGGLRVREHPKRGFFVEGLTSIECANKEEIERLIEEGQLNKSIAATSMNETSSRGHTIYEFHIRQYRQLGGGRGGGGGCSGSGESATAAAGAPAGVHPEVDTLTTSVVQLVDLAGSERMAVHMLANEPAYGPAAGSGTRSGSPFAEGAPSGAAAGTAPRTPARRRAQPSSAASSSSSSAATAATTNSTTTSAAPAAPAASRTTSSLRRPNASALSSLTLMTGNHQQRFKESVSINQSLSALGNCIQVLSQYSQQQQGDAAPTVAAKQPPKIPYRDSVLTKLLNRCCLSGNSRVVLIATLSPAEANYDDTLSTLRFADRAKQIRTHALVNRSSRSGGVGGEAVNALQRENERLKQMLDGRVTRSDDSSQTSNFDDTENMLDNFNGPRAAGPETSSGPAQGAGNSTRGRVAAARNAAGAKSRARSMARSTAAAGAAAATTTRQTERADTPTRGPRAAGRRAQEPPAGQLKVSASNPALAGGAPASRDQMKQLVSPARRKMRQNTRTLGASNADGLAEDDADGSEAAAAAAAAAHKLRKSRSLGQGLARAGAGSRARAGRSRSRSGSPSPAGGRAPAGAELELASSLLDEIDLNELANIIDDENLLSGAESSDENEDDDSLAAARASRRRRAPDEGHLSNAEKVSILNKLLAGDTSNKSTRAIKQKLEENLAAAAASSPDVLLDVGGVGAGAETGASRSRLSRPRKATGGGSRAPPRRVARAEEPAAGAEGQPPRASQLKRTNPYLSNLNSDEQLTGMITYIIRPGEMIVGKSADCDLLIYGPGLRGQHARLIRTSAAESSLSSSSPSPSPSSPELSSSGAADAVFVEPILSPPAANEPAGDKPRRVALMVNGEPVLERTRLAHGDRLLFGSTNYFVLIDHNSAKPPAAQANKPDAATSATNQAIEPEASLDLVTYEMAHEEVLRKIMSDAENEAMIREINDYARRPATGKRARTSGDPQPGGGGGAGGNSAGGARPASRPANDDPARGLARGTSTSSRLTRSLTIGDQDPAAADLGAGAAAAATSAVAAAPVGGLRRIGEEERPLGEPQEPRDAAANAEDDEFRGKLMEDTYEFAMPIAEANAIAKDMGIRVSYGLKILTGEEQLLLDASEQQEAAGDEYPSSELSEVGGGANLRDNNPDPDPDPSQALGYGAADDTQQQQQRKSSFVVSAGREALRPESLDAPPELYVRVSLDELEGVDFYWSKEKFQERRVMMLELYGAWDVGGKSGLVEYLIEQSKYLGYYLLDPFLDDPRASFVLVGHAQVSLQPLAHGANLLESFEVLDVNDEIVGQIQVEVTPCRQVAREGGSEAREPPYRALSEQELSASFLERPAELLGKRLIFLLRIVSCSHVPRRFERIFCQYTLNRERAHVVRTRLARTDGAQARATGTTEIVDEFNHLHYVVVDEVTADLLDFFQHGFLTIQLVGQYNLRQVLAPSASAGGGAAGNQPSGPSTAGSVQSSSSSGSQPSAAHLTLVSSIISGINKYRFRMEQQQQQQQAALMAGGLHSGEPAGSGLGQQQQQAQYNASGAYANSLSDSAKSGLGGYRVAMNSNSGASSVTSASATINLFDQQQDDDDQGSGSLNGASQENIIDMILTKRKLDRAENQLHYIKRTINIAEHYNKKHIPVKTVKKLLNSYGQELENGSLEEVAAEVTTETKSASGKSSGCSIQ